MRYIHLPNKSSPPNISDLAPFKAVVVIQDDGVDGGWQYQVSKWIVQSGCYYMMAWGSKCSSWDDSVDMANLEQFNYSEIPDDKIVMTTWHENELRSHVFWFCEHCVHHDVNESTETVIIDIVQDNRRELIINEYIAAQQGNHPRRFQRPGDL